MKQVEFSVLTRLSRSFRPKDSDQTPVTTNEHLLPNPPPTSSVSAPSPDSVFGAQSGSSSQQSAEAAVTGSSQ
ncbi:hypothetical protein F2Q69_00033490 [Brassica cretica]|uniref:Uncharacterized protein n=1 Tax=Brassica cretica TaxID=69181 RepID=A0A8S9SNF5_BRACR|nr:hypothetical protein F2Q69_00033490 [Brassica cretica]